MHPSPATFESRIDRAFQAGDFDGALAAAREYVRAAGAGPGNGDPGQDPWVRARSQGVLAALAAGRLRQVLAWYGEIPNPATLTVAMAGRLGLAAVEAEWGLGQREAARARWRAGRDVWVDQGQDPVLGLRALRIRLLVEGVAGLEREIAACAGRLGGPQGPVHRATLGIAVARGWLEAGDLARAETALEEALKEARAAGVLLLEAEADVIRGRLFHLRGRLQEALEAYDRVASLGPRAGFAAREAGLRQLLVRMELGQEREAAEGLEAWARARSDAGAEDPDELLRLEAIVRGVVVGDSGGTASSESGGWNAWRRRDFATARTRYREALAQSEGPERQARCALGLGGVSLAQADATGARTWLNVALELAERGGLGEVRWRAAWLLGRVAAELEGDEARARELFEEAVALSEGQVATLRRASDAASLRSLRSDAVSALLLGAARRGDAEAVLRYQELRRGRLLLELRRGAGAGGEEALSRQATELEARREAIREAAERGGGATPEQAAEWSRLGQERDRLLERHLLERSRTDAGQVPPIPRGDDVRSCLPEGVVLVSCSVLGDNLVVLVMRRDGPGRVSVLPEGAGALLADVRAFQREIEDQLNRYRGDGVGPEDTDRLIRQLDVLGGGELGAMLRAEFGGPAGATTGFWWVADPELAALPVHALRTGGRHWIEEAIVASWPSVAAAVSVRGRRPGRGRRGVLVVSDPVLGGAEREGRGVAAAWLRSASLRGEGARREAIRRRLRGVRAAHFACHAGFDPRRPQAACLQLPCGEAWWGTEWLDEPGAEGMALVTLSACDAGAAAPVFDREVFGLGQALLGAGVRSVVASLWELADEQAVGLVLEFYRGLFRHGVGGGLREAQVAAIRSGTVSPLFWGALAVLGDPEGLPPARGWRRCWERLWRWVVARRHRALLSSEGH